MTPKKLIDSIIDKKDRETMLMFFVYSILLALAKYMTKFGIDPIWSYPGACIITIIIMAIVKQVGYSKIEDELDEKIRQENYEIATMITSRGIVSPSQIKGVLEEISKQ